MNTPLHTRDCKDLVRLVCLVLLIGLSPSLAHETTPDMDIRQFVRDSEFVFKGTVERIDYRSSEPVPVVDPATGAAAIEEGQPVFEDGSDLPHSFVLFRIERIYKGKPPVSASSSVPSEIVALRFVGGPYPNDPEEILFVDTHPFFDTGDRCILFVQGNETKACPLVRSGFGRLWLLPDAVRPQINRVFNNYGQELVLVPTPSVVIAGVTVQQEPPRDEVAFGPYHPRQEILINAIGEFVLEKVVVDPEDEYSLPEVPQQPDPPTVKGPHFDEGTFDVFLDEVVAEVHSQRELDALPPINSADPDVPFVIVPFTEDPPPDPGDEPDPPEDPRLWLAALDPDRQAQILEQEREEARLLELTDGDPVLPETPCDVQILTQGAIDGDISGPEGRPDCYVNWWDFVAVAEQWMQCNDPAELDCLTDAP